MSYYADNLPKIQFRLQADNGLGLRTPQWAAACAVTNHLHQFPTEPGLVIMPTGTGKTGVMGLIPFLLPAKRVLIVTPGVLLRDQIFERIGGNTDLARAGLTQSGFRKAKALSLTSDEKPPSKAALKKYDLVVGNIQAVTREAGLDALTAPDIFDLLILDEAHHSPAATWNDLLRRLPHARKVLFTATPFRGDGAHIEARTLFFYSIENAKKEGYFGDITFKPIKPSKAQTDDVALAKAAAVQFDADRAKGFHHLVLVRTSSVKRAKELDLLYRNETKLRLVTVSSDRSLIDNREAIKKLTDGNVDGAICINMMGEGLDIPQLKIAALHAPHKSVAVTLQFIGRLARVTGDKIGPTATVLATENSLELAGEELYQEAAAWPAVIHKLAKKKMEVRERSEAFTAKLITEDEFDTSNVNPIALQFGMYARIYQAQGPVKIPKTLTPLHREKLVYAAGSRSVQIGIYIFRNEDKVPWYRGEGVSNVTYDIYLIAYMPQTKFLFVTGSNRSESVLKEFALQSCPAGVSALPMTTLSAVTNGLNGIRVFSVGMRSRAFAASADTYRMLAGPAADRGVSLSDGRLYDRGHFFARGEKGVDNDAETIGVSANSVIWSTSWGGVAAFYRWCESISSRLEGGAALPTLSRLDLLESGKENKEFPSTLFVALWDSKVWNKGVKIGLKTEMGRRYQELSETELSIRKQTKSEVNFCLKLFGQEYHFSCDLDGQCAQLSDDAGDQIIFNWDNLDKSTKDFFLAFPLSFISRDGDRIEGRNRYGKPLPEARAVNAILRAVDWVKARIDVHSEKDDTADGSSIFAWTIATHTADQFDVIFCDDGSLEIADFVCLKREKGATLIRLVHCKAFSKKKTAGARVGDFAVVCAQALRSCAWIDSQRLLKQIQHRSTLQSYFAKGDFALAEKLLVGSMLESDAFFEIHIVQPALSCAGISDELGKLFLATDQNVRNSGGKDFLVFGS